VLLGHMFEVARKEWGIHVHNPVRDIKLPANGKTRDPFLLPIVQLALETAMRQGELVRLRWKHIDLKRRIAYLPDTKNGESRTVPLSSTAIKVLLALPRGIHVQVFPVTTEAVKRAYITGHKDLRMLKRYTHLRAEDLARKLG